MSTEFHYAAPPILLDNVIDDLDAVVALFERNAPYTPLGGWFRPDSDISDINDTSDTSDKSEAMSAMWFQNDWVHADFAVEGSDLFFRHDDFIAAAKSFYNAEVVIPHTIYVNLMAAIAEGGPAHTDNPVFRGRNRTNTAMMLLRTMLWSGLFEHWMITQATSIWWMNDVEGGGLRYWPEGPDKPPAQHANGIANTALVGDNHGMFHQVEPVGPFDQGTRWVSAHAELKPANDGSNDWVVNDRGVERYRAPLAKFRASVLWKADIYATEAERKRVEHDNLSLEQVVEIFNHDLQNKGVEFRVELNLVEDAQHIALLSKNYPEAKPIGACKSIFDR